MSAASSDTTALLTEHFRYTPLTLLDDIINTVNELVFRAINAIEEGLANTTPEQLGFGEVLDHQKQLRACKDDDEREQLLMRLKTDEIDAGIVKLESLLNATVDKDFDKFEIYTLRNILAVGHEEDGLADWVQLDHYKGLNISPGEGAVTPEELQMQRRKLHETQKLNAMLKAEEARNAAILAQLRSLLGGEDTKDVGVDSNDFSFLTQSSPTISNVQYALSQLPALRQLLEQLKGGLQILPNARRADDQNSTAVSRRRYIGTQSKRALERKGINVDGAAPEAGLGRRLARDEIEGLEAVVQALGGGERD